MKTMAGSISSDLRAVINSVRNGERYGNRGPLPRGCHCGERPWKERRTAWSIFTPSLPGFPLTSRGISKVSLSSRRWAAKWCRSTIGRCRSTMTSVVPRTERSQAPSSFGVVYRGGQADEADLGWREDQDLFPHPAAVGVLYEVDLVEDHRVQPGQEVRAGQQHVAQHLGGHHHHWCIRAAPPCRPVRRPTWSLP